MKARNYREKARDVLSGNWFKAIIATLIVSLITGCFSVNYNTDSLQDSTIPEDGGIVSTIASLTQQESSDELATAILIAYAVLGVVFFGSALLQVMVSGVMSVGLSRFNLDMIDFNPLKIRTVFSGFNNLKVAIVSHLRVFLRIFIGTIFFVIPGIIASFTYSVLPYVIADNPDMTACEAMSECRHIMKGNRWKLFCLSMSFFGWYLVGFLTLGVGLLWVMPYHNAAIAVFYREAKRNA